MEVVIITNVITTYREGFYDRLLKRDDINLTIYCQEKIPGMNLKSIHAKYPHNIRIVRAWIGSNESIGFQFLPFFKIFKSSDVIFLDGNPRILSNWIMSFISLFFKHKRIVMWTMAHSFGANKFTENIRLWWTSIHKNIFVYTDKEARSLYERGWTNHHILGMNNGLDQTLIDQEQSKWSKEKLGNWLQNKRLENNTLILSVARLVPKNKFELIIAALPHIIAKVPNLKWVLVGNGNQESYLKKLAEDRNLEDYIQFEGAIYGDVELAPYFLSAQIFVHPSSIGLSIMHAFGYGLPVIVDAEERMHGPEYAAFENNTTGLNFKKDDAEDLAAKIIKLLNDPSEIMRMKNNVQDLARNKYNVDVMVSRFIEMCKAKTDV